MISRRLFLTRPFGSQLSASQRPRLNVQLRHLRNVGARSASTTTEEASHRVKNYAYGTIGVLLVSLGYLYLTDTRASVHKYTAPLMVQWLYPDAEEAHKVGVAAMKELYSLGIHPRERGFHDGELQVEVFGEDLTNPIGISGGLDKHAEIPDALFALGPSIVEIGGITPHPQDGNPQPRVFRIPSEKALINRYGLPSEGADVVAMRLRQRVREYAYSVGLGIDEVAEQAVLNGYAGVPPGSLHQGRLLAVQIAKNKATPDSDLDAVVEDHVYCVKQLGPYADIIVVNVSSPNTPGLRAFQDRAPLTQILTAVVDAAKAVNRQTPPAVMVKVSPDEDTLSQIKGICDAVWTSGVDGVIVGNTTKLRPETALKDASLPPSEVVTLREQGGFSGPHLYERSLQLVQTYRRILDHGPRDIDEAQPEPASKPASSGFESEIDGAIALDNSPATLKAEAPPAGPEPTPKKPEALQQKVIFASGGIVNGEQALQILNAGASVAMVYTALVYGGAGTISNLKDEMKDALNKSKK
jgi:dihydroorotate dehydrogenase